MEYNLWKKMLSWKEGTDRTGQGVGGIEVSRYQV